MASSSDASRLSFIDWTRGFGAAIMLQGHAFHSFTDPSLRETPTWIYSQFLGGMPPAIFLFLTGTTLAFLMDSLERRHVAASQRILGALKRARYLLVIAVLFRLQMWLFGLPKPWEDLLKVDVLNCMAVSVGMFSLLAVLPARERARIAAILGLAIALAAPLISALDWSGVSVHVARYVVPDPNYFGIFPWASFLAFGLAFGTIVRMVPGEFYARLMQWTAITGMVVIYASRYASDLPFSLYAKSEFWIDSPLLVFIKVGVTLLMLSFGYLWTTFLTGTSWSWIRELGTHSLLVYWVHVELVYGRWFWFWKESLTIPQATLTAAGVIGLMVGMAWLAGHHTSVPWLGWWRRWRMGRVNSATAVPVGEDRR